MGACNTKPLPLTTQEHYEEELSALMKALIVSYNLATWFNEDHNRIIDQMKSQLMQENGHLTGEECQKIDALRKIVFNGYMRLLDFYDGLMSQYTCVRNSLAKLLDDEYAATLVLIRKQIEHVRKVGRILATPYI